MGIGSHRAPVYLSSTCYIFLPCNIWLNRFHHMKRLIVPYSVMTLVPRLMINNYSDTKFKSDVESYIEVNVGEQLNSEEVNVSGVIPVLVECLMIVDVTPVRKLFQAFYGLDTTS